MYRGYVQVDDFKMYSKVFQGKKLQLVSANLIEEDYIYKTACTVNASRFIYIRRFPN